MVSFGKAIKALKKGKRVKRKTWNGVGLFVFMQVSADISMEIVPIMQSLPQSVKDEFIRRQSENKMPESFITENGLTTKRQDHIYGWVASPTDVLMEDWIILD